MPIFGNKNLDVYLEEKGDRKGKKIMLFYFRLVIDLHYSFHFTFEPFSTPKSGYDPVVLKIGIANISIKPTEHS